MTGNVHIKPGVGLLLRHQSRWQSLGGSGFGLPAIGPDGVRTRLEPNPNRAFVLHRTAMKLNQATRRWQTSLRFRR